MKRRLPDQSFPAPKRINNCSGCGQQGHNRRTCPNQIYSENSSSSVSQSAWTGVMESIEGEEENAEDLLASTNDSTNGYMSRFYLYKGRKEQRPGDIPATLWPYKQLITEDMRDKNYIIATDNWFTSMEAVEYILSTNNQLVGTVRKNRRNIPKRQIMNTKTKRGTIKQSKTEINGRNVFFTSWMDTKDVYFLSTFQGKKATTTRKSFNKTNNQWGLQQINAPSIANLYNKIIEIEVVDLKNIIHFLTVSAFNAYILYKESKKLGKYNFLTYLKTLVMQLVEEYLDLRSGGTITGQPPAKNTKKMWEKNPLRWTGKHAPIILKPDNHRIRGRCLICGRQTTIQCKECHVYLCLESHHETNETTSNDDGGDDDDEDEWEDEDN
eukprot:gene3846-4108_t